MTSSEILTDDDLPLNKGFFSPFRPLAFGWLISFAAFSTIAVLVSAQFVTATNSTIAVAVKSSLRDWLPWAIVTPLLFRLVTRAPLDRRSSLLRILLHVSACLLVISFCNFWKDLVDPDFQARPGGASRPPSREQGLLFPKGPPPLRERPAHHLFDAVHIATFQLPLYLMVLCAAHAVVFYRRDQERASSLTRARLEALKSQLQPHFLFNTLNAIAELVHLEPARADLMLTALSQLLRATLEVPSDKLIPLQTEISFIEHYLEIMHIRFEDRLRYEFLIDKETQAALVPPLLLQPLVENSIRHGLAAATAREMITVKASIRDAMLHLSVSDDGVGLKQDGPTREGLGLTNTRARLRAFFGNKATLLLRDNEGACAEIALPLTF